MAHMCNGGYWIRSVRRGDRTTSVYYGGGEMGLLLAAMDAVIADRRRAERLERDRAEASALEKLAEERRRGLAIRRTAASVLEGMGFSRYQRTSRWRYRAMDNELANRDAWAPPSRQEIQSLVREAQAGEGDAQARLAALAGEHPKAVATAVTTSFYRAAKRLLADAVTPDPAMATCVEARIDWFADELAGPGASLSMKLLAAVVAFSAQEYWVLTAAGAKRLSQASPAELRRQAAAQKRYLASLRTFAAIKKLEEG